MERTIGNTELIVNPDGSVYHLQLKPGEIADTVIVVGDAKRVDRISAYFDFIEMERVNRDFHSVTGVFRKKRLSVVSTGIGPDNIDIVVNELDALVNIDLKFRTPKQNHTSLNIIRLGTSGGVQYDVPVDAFVASTHGLGLDGLIFFYREGRNIEIKEISDAFISHMNWPQGSSRPYVVKGSDLLLDKIGKGLIRGITATSPGFYGPQGRNVRIQSFDDQFIEKISTFEYLGLRVMNIEMETSALFGLSALLGHQAMSVCVAAANRLTHQFSDNYQLAVDKLIRLLLDRLAE
jgi:uridine phosphorylase